jgi:hypothetical protein
MRHDGIGRRVVRLFPPWDSGPRIRICVVPTVHVVDETPVASERVLEAARDFSERRAEMWPDVHVEHLHVHEAGETFAEVTEGNPWPIGFVWERLRYDWSEPGSVKGVVTDSNIFKPGSTWEIKATPIDGGSRVEVIGVRHLRGLQGQAADPRVPTWARKADRGRPPPALPLHGRAAGGAVPLAAALDAMHVACMRAPTPRRKPELRESSAWNS